ncbi:MAG: hypothetical protein H7062_18090, partial [Candidatus Saccharimonas sp.]|nr:hypothetical protein [Planctomycetaceae bacterium]
ARSRADDEQLIREQRETDRVLNRLDPETTDDADHAGTENLDADGSVFTLGASRTNRSTDEVATDESSGSPGTSKLAEWEREIQQISDKGTSATSNPAADERAARAQLERDRLNREQELRDRLHEQRARIEQERQEQLERLERERAATAHAEWEAARADAERERIRLEREQLLHDDQDRDQAPPERLTFDRAAREEPSAEDELDDESDLDADDEDLNTTEAADSEDESNRPPRPPGWLRDNQQRARRRGRHRRDGR